MTVKPTLGPAKSVGAVLGAADWNVNVINQGNYVDEVLAGTNADKIPDAALNTVDASRLTGSLNGVLLAANSVAPGTLQQPVALAETVGGGFKVGQARLFTVGNALYLTQNCVYSTTPSAGFYVDTVGKPAWALRIGQNDGANFNSFTLLESVSGVNPASFATLLNISPSGQLTGSGFYDSGEFTITNGASVSLTLPFPGGAVGPRFVWGLWGTSSGNSNRPISSTYGVATNVGFGTMSTGVINAANSSGATAYCRVWAMY